MKTSTCRVVRSLDHRRNWLKAAGLGIVGAVLGRPLAAAGKHAKKSVQLHIYIEAKTGMGKKLEKLYRGRLRPRHQGAEGLPLDPSPAPLRVFHHVRDRYLVPNGSPTGELGGFQGASGGLAQDRGGWRQDHLAGLRRAGLSRPPGFRPRSPGWPGRQPDSEALSGFRSP